MSLHRCHLSDPEDRIPCLQSRVGVMPAKAEMAQGEGAVTLGHTLLTAGHRAGGSVLSAVLGRSLAGALAASVTAAAE